MIGEKKSHFQENRVVVGMAKLKFLFIDNLGIYSEIEFVTGW